MKYGVCLEGKNFELKTEDGIENFGFITTRFVRAKTPDEAEVKAVELVKTDQNLLGRLDEERKLEPMIYLVEYWKESWWKRLGGLGYSFYSMNTDDE